MYTKISLCSLCSKSLCASAGSVFKISLCLCALCVQNLSALSARSVFKISLRSLRALCSKSLCASAPSVFKNLYCARQRAIRTRPASPEPPLSNQPKISALSARSVFKIFCTPAKPKTQQYRALQPFGTQKTRGILGTTRGAFGYARGRQCSRLDTRRSRPPTGQSTISALSSRLWRKIPCSRLTKTAFWLTCANWR